MATQTPPKKTEDALRDLGLTDYEVKAYVALISHGRMTASEISSKSAVPYTRVYDVLKLLEEKSFVKVERGRPSMYIPRPPGEATRTHLLQMEETLNFNRRVVVENLQPLYEKSGTHERHDILIIRGEESVTAKVVETVERAQWRIMILTPLVADEYLSLILPRLERLAGKGVKIRLILTSDLEELPPGITQITEIRMTEMLPGAAVIVDEREILFIILDPEVDSVERGAVGLWADHAGIAKIATLYYNIFWNTLSDLTPKAEIEAEKVGIKEHEI